MNKISLAVLCGALHAAAWSFEAGIVSCLFGWLAVLTTAGLLNQKTGNLLSSYVAGVVTYSLGFSWLYTTLHGFGGFPVTVSILLQVAFVTISAVQFVIYAAAYQFLPIKIQEWVITPALCWIFAEQIWIRIFPWEPAHTQIGFNALTQLASVSGSQVVTLCLFISAQIVLKPEPKNIKWGAILCLVLLLGWSKTESLRSEIKDAPTRKIAIIQANVQLEEGREQTMFAVNRERYQELSVQVAGENRLIIWPEAVNTEFVPDEVKTISETEKLPEPVANSTILFGGLTYNKKREVFNSSILIANDGSVLPPYHKQVLMPFGEYMPFSSLFPELDSLLPSGAAFTPGKEVKVYYDGETKLSPLICYEDLLPSIARKATALGSNLLVNQSNDIWFGRGIAAYQHHRIASFRAIENQRFLVRSTNTGYSGVITPLGETSAYILPYSEGVLTAEVSLLESSSVFGKLIVDKIWYYAAWVFYLFVFGRIFVERHGKTKG